MHNNSLFIKEISSAYNEWLPYLKNKEKIQHIIEVGTFNGGGTLFLKNHFPSATISTFELPHPAHPNYLISPSLKILLEDNINFYSIRSPPSEFNHDVDLVVFDIGYDKDNIEANLHFWMKKLKKEGTLIALLPWSTEEKRLVREGILLNLERKGISYEKIVNWILINP